MKSVAAACLVASATAAASPLGIAWTQNVSCESPGANTRYPDRTFAVAGGIVWIDGKRLVRRELATGAAVSEASLGGYGASVVGRTSDALLLRDRDGFAMYDAVSLKPRWHVAAKAGIDPQRVGVVGDDVAYLDDHKVLSLLDGKTGAARWQRPLGHGGIFRWLGGSAAFVYLYMGDTIEAFAASDGKRVWTHDEPSPAYVGDFGWPVGRELVYERSKGLGKVDEHGAGSTVDIESPMLGAIDGGFAFVAAAHDIAAIDLARMKVVWRTPYRDTLAKVAGVTATSVYVADDDVLRELDRSTGKQRATYGIADETIVATRATPALLACNGSRLMALDPSASDVPVETTTVTGRIVCKACAKPIDVRIGDVTGKTDATGRFSLTVTGRGTFFVSASLDGQDHKMQAVHMDGSKTHALGKLEGEPQPEGD